MSKKQFKTRPKRVNKGPVRCSQHKIWHSRDMQCPECKKDHLYGLRCDQEIMMGIDTRGMDTNHNGITRLEE